MERKDIVWPDHLFSCDMFVDVLSLRQAHTSQPRLFALRRKATQVFFVCSKYVYLHNETDDITLVYFKCQYQAVRYLLVGVEPEIKRPSIMYKQQKDSECCFGVATEDLYSWISYDLWICVKARTSDAEGENKASHFDSTIAQIKFSPFCPFVSSSPNADVVNRDRL